MFKESKKETILRLEKELETEKARVKEELEKLASERRALDAAKANQAQELKRLQERREKIVDDTFGRRVQAAAKEMVDGAQNKQIEEVHNLIVGAINRVPAHVMVYLMAMDFVRWQLIQDARSSLGADQAMTMPPPRPPQTPQQQPPPAPPQAPQYVQQPPQPQHVQQPPPNSIRQSEGLPEIFVKD